MARAAAALLAAAMLGGGCASGDLPLALPSGDELETVRLWGARSRQVVLVAPFEDGRDARERCGVRRDGLGAVTGDAICRGDPAAWIAGLLAEKLRAAGLSVPGETGPERPRALRIEGTLLKLFVEPVGGPLAGRVEADLSVALRATTGSGLVAERTFYVKGWTGAGPAAGADPFRTSLERASEALVDEVVVAVVELLNRYRLGGAPAPDALARRPRETPR